MSKAMLVLSIGMLVLLAGCSPSAPAATPARVEAATQSVPPAAAPTEAPAEAPAASGSWRDLEAVNLCSLIHNDEVAQLFGAEPTRGDAEGVSGPTCFYQITPDNGETVRNVYVYLFGEDLAEVTLQLARESGEIVPGLGDEAYMEFDEVDQQYHLTAVKAGDYGVEIGAPDGEGAIRLAEMILERL